MIQKHRMPKKTDFERTFLLNETTELYDARIEKYVKEQQAKGWTFYIAGIGQYSWTKYGPKQVTISLRHVLTGRAYTTYILAHELAHTYAGFHAGHGPIFMEWLKRICPPELQHYEYEYKPKSALRAGIGFDSLTDEDLMP